MSSMQTFTKLGTFALTFALTISTTLAQQPVRKPVVKAVHRPHASTSKVVTTPVRKPIAAPATAPKTQAQEPAPVANTAPTVTHQAQPQAQPVTKPTLTAHHRPAGKHDVYLNAGIGLATYYGGGVPIGISVEVAGKNNFSVGGSIDYFRYNNGYYSSGYTFVYAGARASYHLAEALNVQTSSFDPYVGATLGFRHAGYSDSYGYSYYDGYSSSYNSGLFIGIHAGARFLFSPKVGAFAEVGYGISALKLGLTAKF
ncbi:hypothetical protein [Spirosoma jeollabukense]